MLIINKKIMVVEDKKMTQQLNPKQQLYQYKIINNLN